MLVKEKFYRSILIERKNYFLKILFIYIFLTSNSYADLQKNIINKLEATKTLSFNFQQEISNKKEIGFCFIKYPLLMKCEYKNLKKKVIISNGKTVAVIKKKYKKIYLYPIKTTPLFTLLKKEKIINLVRNSKPKITNSKLVEFSFTDEKSNQLHMFFDQKSFDLKGWKTIDAYSNNVSFMINDLKTNLIIEDKFFKIPKQKDL